MNKLFTKIAAVFLGVTMAVGVGVAVSTSAKASQASAAGEVVSYDLDLSNADALKSRSPTGSYNYTTEYTLTMTSGNRVFTAYGFNPNNYTVAGTRFGNKNTGTTMTNLSNGPTTGSNYVQYISTNAVISDAITKVEITTLSDFDTCTKGDGYVQVSANSNFSSSANYKFTHAANSTIPVTITSPNADRYYRIVWQKASSSKNAGIIVSHIKFYYATAKTQTITVVPASKEAYVDETISVSSDASTQVTWSIVTGSGTTASGAAVTSGGVVSVTGPGKVTVKATASGYSDATVELTFNQRSTTPTITLNGTSFKGYTGQNFSVTATYANLNSDFSWVTSGSGTTTETITSTGTARQGTSTYSGTLTGEGTKTLSATGGGATTQTYTVDIAQTTVDITKSSTSIPIGESETLAVTHNASSVGGLTWESNNAKVSVNNDGKVTVASDAAEGSTATITATSNVDSNVSDTCIVTVSAAPSTYTWDLTVDSTSAASTTNLTWTSEIAVMSADKYNASTNTNNYYPGTEGKSYTSTRFYGGSMLTITPESDYSIIKAVFTAMSDSYATVLRGSSWTNASTSGESSEVIVTPTNGENAFYAVIDGTCGFSSVELYYEGGSSTTSYEVVDDIDYGSLNVSSIEEGETLQATITPDSGYILPTSLTSVTMGGEDVQYTYENGVVTVVNVQGDIVISGECPIKPATEIRGKYTLVSDLSTLTSDSLVVILNKVEDVTDKAISTTQNTNNRAATSITTSNNEFTIIDSNTDVQVFEITNHGNNVISFYATNGKNKGFIYAAASSSNHLKTQSEDDVDSQFTVTLSNGEFTIDAVSSSNRGKMRYNPNNGSPMFSCYASNSTTGSAPVIYKLTSPYDPSAVASVTLDQTDIRIGTGSTLELTATVLPETATDKSVTWSVIDANPSGCVTVTNGVVFGAEPGNATVVVTTNSGSKQATCSVEVAELEYGFYYKIEQLSELSSGDKIVLVSSSDYGIAQNAISNKKITSPSIPSSYHWENDVFGDVSVDSTRVDKSTFEWTIIEDSGSWKFTTDDPNAETVNYLKNSSGTDLAWDTDNSNATWSITKNSESDTFKIQNNSTSRYLSYRSDMKITGAYADIDETTYHSTRIYKLVDNPRVLTGLTCSGTGSYEGDWESLQSTFSGYSKGEKAYYKHASYIISGYGVETVVTPTDGTDESIAKFVAKYDDVVSKYHKTDFIGRNPSLRTNNSVSVLGNINSENINYIVIITIVSLASLSAIGGYFFLRKRREEN